MLHLYSIPAWQIALGFMVLLALAIEAGHRLGRRIDKGDIEGLATVQAAVIGVVGLLLAFSFSMASNRYDLRKQVTVKEANALGTLYLRAKLLPEPARTVMRARVRQYADARLEYVNAGVDEGRIRRAEDEAVQLQRELWALLDREADAGLRDGVLLLVAPALNDVIDVYGERNAAHDNQVPEPALILLGLSILLAGALVGYRPHVTTRNTWLWAGFALLVTLVLFGVLDFDRPRRGFIRVSQAPIVDARESMEADAP